MPRILKIDDYFKQFPVDVQKRLKEIQSLGKKLIPGGKEVFSYGVPAFKLKKNVFVYAAFKEHIGIYPEPETIVHFRDKLKDYETAKETIKFPHDRPLPMDLIREIIEYRLSVM
jgi:uncharacterized protein YdhG (YjbR/CyaY superfamily)